MSHMVPIHITAKLPRSFRWIMRGLRVLRLLRWSPNDAQVARIAAWVGERTDVEVSEGRPERDNSGAVLDASP